MKKVLLIFLIALLAFSCSKTTDGDEPQEKDVVDVLPLDNEISGWTKVSATQIAENESQLWDLINGAGQVYIDNGFVKCVFQSYTGDIQGGPVELKLRIFDMGDSTNAQDVFDEVGDGSEIPWNEAGEEARYKLETGVIVNYYILDMRDAKFYVWIEIDHDHQDALNVAQLFAMNISQAIRAD